MIHHLDENKTNNDIANLAIVTRADHNAHRNAERGRRLNGQFRKKGESGDHLDGLQHLGFPDPSS